MDPEIKKICSDLKDVLNFRNYIELPDDDDRYFCISNEELKSGKIRTDDEGLKADDNRLKKLSGWIPKKPVRNSDRQDEEVEVLLIPKVVCDMIPRYCQTISLNKKQAWEYRKISLLYIKAKCNLRTLELAPVAGESLIWSDPIIKPRHSNDILHFLSKIIGKLSDKHSPLPARFELKEAPGITDNGDDWKTYISKVEDDFKKRTGKDFFSTNTLADEKGIAHQLYMDSSINQTIVMKDDTVFATFHIANLLSHIISEHNPDLRLLKTMFLDKRDKKTLVSRTSGNRMWEHVGQMKNDYPLANAQRDAVHYFNRLKDGEVLAVSGPPGTGKTTMLQSIVADMLVRTALRNKGGHKEVTSPLILATSANNKAITNIIDAFSSSDGNSTGKRLHTRWLCYEVNGEDKSVPMAVYFPAGSVNTGKRKDYFTTDIRDGGGDYKKLCQRYSVTNPTEFYNCANDALGGRYGSVGSIKNKLSEMMDYYLGRLNEIDQVITCGAQSDGTLNQKIEKIVDEYGTNDKVRRFVDDYLSDDPMNNLTDAPFVDRLLDLTVRYDLYWLAVHYNECRWIEELHLRMNKTEDSAGQKRKIFGISLLKEIRYVCPCIVSTFFSAPKLFEFKQYGTRNYKYGYADLLIVDEAGQVSPEIGLPTFALANKAIVVGDVRQIPPVYRVPEITDEAYWKGNVGKDTAGPQHKLLSCCSSSIMTIAQKRCPFERITKHGDKKDGLFLDEHRRCVDEIIDYSNRLIYDGELVPKRGPSSASCKIEGLPPMGIYVSESPSKAKDGSRYNNKEIEAIRNWIKSNASAIRNAYCNKELKELINIITPFKAQASLIRRDEYLKDFPAGTVHTFQGAESPIVIFSMVYGEKDNPAFIKSNHELMNVAVSRAKDHFILVGSQACLENNDNEEACCLLNTMLKPVNP